MNAVKAIEIYTLTVPAPTSAQQSALNFFKSPCYQTLYFISQTEAILYQNKYFPKLSLDPHVLIAAKDIDEQGMHHWILIEKSENMNNSNYNKSITQRYYDSHSIDFLTTPSLEKEIQKNPSSILIVKERSRDEWQDGGEMGGPSGVKITYDCADISDESTRFLYVSGNDRWFVNRGQEIIPYDAQLELQSEIRLNEKKLQALLAERNALKIEQEQLASKIRP